MPVHYVEQLLVRCYSELPLTALPFFSLTRCHCYADKDSEHNTA